MDLGIKGKKAIVCAASKGLGKGCAQALAREGVTLRSARAEPKRSTPRPRSWAHRREGDAGRVRRDHRGRPQGPARRLSQPRYPGQQRRRPAARRLQGFFAGRLAQGGRGQHDQPHRPHPRHRLRHDGARLRPHRQHHLGQSIKAPIAALELSNGARLGLTGAVAVLARKASSRNVTINGILPGPFDTDRLRARPRGWRIRARWRCRWSRPSARPPCPRAASARPRSSVPSSPSCARRTQATSPARTC